MARPQRIGALIPVRLASERLPGKALSPVSGRPMIAQLIDQVRASRHVDPRLIVICTTTDASDDPLLPAVMAAGAQVFRGARDDLIDRLASAAVAYDLDLVLQVDGDDPLADSEYMDRAVDALLQDPSADVAVVNGLPLGIASKAIRRRAFDVVRRAYRTVQNDTGFGYLFTRSGLCRVVSVEAAPEHACPDARLTLDYPEDLQLFRALIENLGSPGCAITLDALLAHLRAHPGLVQLNAWRSDEYWERTAERTVLEYEDERGARHRIVP